MPPVEPKGRWPNQVRAVASIEKSLFDARLPGLTATPAQHTYGSSTRTS